MQQAVICPVGVGYQGAAANLCNGAVTKAVITQGVVKAVVRNALQLVFAVISILHPCSAVNTVVALLGYGFGAVGSVVGFTSKFVAAKINNKFTPNQEMRLQIQSHLENSTIITP